MAIIILTLVCPSVTPSLSMDWEVVENGPSIVFTFIFKQFKLSDWLLYWGYTKLMIDQVYTKVHMVLFVRLFVSSWPSHAIKTHRTVAYVTSSLRFTRHVLESSDDFATSSFPSKYNLKNIYLLLFKLNFAFYFVSHTFTHRSYEAVIVFVKVRELYFWCNHSA